MDIVIESHIPYAEGLFESEATVMRLAPEEIDREALMSADALITRTRVRCNAELLEGTACRMIASATIGLDHVDTEWCAAHGVEVSNAPGCNAPAVAQYVLASLQRLYGRNLAGMRLGIVGVGHVGSVVERWACGLGIEVLDCDPPRADAEGRDKEFFPLSHLAQSADAITFHTPLTVVGPHATRHLADERFFRSLRRRPAIINSARGPVVDNAAWSAAVKSGHTGYAIVDCWENEPNVSPGLLAQSVIATPHIAGYSRQGKIRATAMAAKAVSRHFGLREPKLSVPVPAAAPTTVTADEVWNSYNPLEDTEMFRRAPQEFEKLRNTYALRDEPGTKS